MKIEEENKKKDLQKPITWRVPDCCREGRADCPHVVKRQEIRKAKNVGL